MNKEFVTYEQALALKKLGFNESCFGKYDIYGSFDHKLFYHNHDGETSLNCSAPTFSQAFRWFRKKDYYSEVRVGCTQIDGSIGYEWWVWKPNRIEEWSPEVPGEEWSYETYEEAEQACLDKLIQIVKNNG